MTATNTQLVPPWVMDPKEPKQHCVTTIILLRHAKSSWDDPSLDDFDRPLATKGIRSAIQLGEYLHDHQVPTPDYIVSSPSNRTRSTLALVEQGWVHTKKGEDKGTPIEFRRELYDDAPVSYIGFLMQEIMNLASSSYSTCRSYHRLLLVGHNPAIEDLARALYPDIAHFKTTGYCEFHLQRGWSDVLELLQRQQQQQQHQQQQSLNHTVNNSIAGTTDVVKLGLCTTL